jgi:hypothetical protein
MKKTRWDSALFWTKVGIWGGINVGMILASVGMAVWMAIIVAETTKSRAFGLGAGIWTYFVGMSGRLWILGTLADGMFQKDESEVP